MPATVRTSLRGKLVVVTLVTTAVALLAAGSAFIVQDREISRRSMAQDLSVLASAVGMNCAPALLFLDQDAATEVLAAFRAEPHVSEARLIDAHGTVFARYLRGQREPEPPSKAGETLTRVEPVRVDGEVVGTLWVRMELDKLEARVLAATRSMGLAALGAAALSLLLAGLLQRIIARPIHELTRAAQAVATRKDYSVRALKTSGDEIGFLIDVFNAMLERIERRDQELARHRETLEAEVQHRTAELRTLNEQLTASRDEAQAAAVAKSQFLANMSHEIRTPMNGVMGMTSILLDTRLDAQQKDLARTVLSCAEDLLRIINDILDFSKIEAGRVELETIDFDLRAVLEGAADLVHPAARGKQLELGVLVEPDVPTALRGDPGRLRQVVLNFLNNAVKFTSRGEVLLVARLESQEDDAVVVRVEVRDTGIGIPADRLDRLFQVFSQVDSSTTRRFGGTGLGLAISKQLAEAMGGRVGVTSREGQGSEFWFTVRLARQPVQPRRPVDLRADLRGLHVLVVDDNGTNRRILTHQLEAWGCWPTPVPGAAEALDELRRAAVTPWAYGLVLLDMHMPGMSGEELAAAISADELLRGLPLVMLTSGYKPRDVRRFQELGIHGYLTKPIKASRLFDAIALVLDADAVRRQAPELPPSTVTEESLEAHRRAATLSILVVEDNPVNQRVAVGLLQRKGYRCQVAADGSEALLALEQHDYDIIFMDCQMPVMDGFETTAEIRRREQGSGRRTPIVAMTANAMKEDSDRCLAAGMDDYIAKPVHPERIYAALEKWCPAATRPD